MAVNGRDTDNDDEIFLSFMEWVRQEQDELRGGSVSSRYSESVDSASEESKHKEELTITQLKLQDTYTKQNLLDWLNTQALHVLDMTTLNLLYIFGNLLSQMFTRWEYYKQNVYIQKLMTTFDQDKYNFLSWNLNDTFKELAEGEDALGIVDKVTHSLYNLSCMLALKMSTHIKVEQTETVARKLFPNVVEYLVPSTNLLESKIQLLDKNLHENVTELVKELRKLKSIAEQEQKDVNIHDGEAKLKQDLQTQHNKIENILLVKLKILQRQLQNATHGSGTSIAIPNCKFSPITKGLPVILLAIAKADKIGNIRYGEHIELLLQFITNLMNFFTNISKFIEDQLDILSKIYSKRKLQMKAEGFDTSAETSEQTARQQLTQLSVSELTTTQAISSGVNFDLDLRYDSGREKDSIIKNIKDYITCQILITFLSFKTDFLKACNLTYIEVLNQDGLVNAYVQINHEILGIPSELVSLWVSNLIFLVLDCAVNVINNISDNNTILKGLLCASILSNTNDIDIIKKLLSYFTTISYIGITPQDLLHKFNEISRNSGNAMPFIFKVAKFIHLVSLEHLQIQLGKLLQPDEQDKFMQIQSSFTHLSITFCPIGSDELMADYISRLNELTNIKQLKGDTVASKLVPNAIESSKLLQDKVREYYSSVNPEFQTTFKSDRPRATQIYKSFLQTVGMTLGEIHDDKVSTYFVYFVNCSTIFTIKHIEEILVTLFTDLLGQVNICVRIGTANPSLVRPNPEDTDKLQLLQQQIKAMNIQFGIENEFSTQELLHMITNTGVFPVNLEMDYIGSSNNWKHATRSLTTYSYKTAAGICQTGIILHTRKEIDEATKTLKEKELSDTRPKRYSTDYTDSHTQYANMQLVILVVSMLIGKRERKTYYKS